MLRIFKIVALLEGVSYLALFTNMLLVKPNNITLYKSLLYPIGMSHGVLFMAYIILAIILKINLNWGWKKFAIICVASILPFATFYVEQKYLKNA